jgi:hypothetical protein
VRRQSLYEEVDVREGLSRVQVLQVVHGPVREGLRGAVVTVLQDREQTVQLLADLEGIASLCRRSAGSLTADVEEDGPGFVVPVFVVDPVSLREVSLVEEVEVIEGLNEVQLLEVLQVHLLVDSASLRCECHNSTSCN